MVRSRAGEADRVAFGVRTERQSAATPFCGRVTIRSSVSGAELTQNARLVSACTVSGGEAPSILIPPPDVGLKIGTLGGVDR